ncbi:MAG TPA: MFS transporter [Gaiellaceae bacterium]|nr:MFS transporter [Gaiellaceae bacterium]
MRRLLALVSSIIFVDALLFTALTPLVPAYAEEFDLSKAGAGLLVGAYGAGALFGGIPGGLAAARFGPKRAVIGGLILLSVSSFAFAASDSAVTLGGARLVQGLSSTATWAGALAWLSVSAPRERRGEIIGTAFGVAIFGAILGPVFGGLAELVSITLAFTVVGVLTLGFAGLAALAQAAPRETVSFAGVGRAFRDERFVGGLWLNMLPATLFGLLIVLTPLALDDAGWGTFAIAAVFFGAGLVEVVLNPMLGRYSDRVGRLVPIRAALMGATVVALALAVSSRAALIALLVCAASISFGSLYTPGMSLTSHRAETVGLAQGLAFGIMNTAWAFGELVGPTAGGALAESTSDAVPYLIGACLCALTLAATYRVSGRMRARAA